MQARGGRGHAPGPLRVHGLVTLGVLQRVVDIRGQGQCAEGRQVVDQALHLAAAIAQPLSHLDHRLGPGVENGAGRQAAPGAHQRLETPRSARHRLQEQHLGRPPALLLQGQPGGHDPRRVDDQEVPRLQQVRQRRHTQVAHRLVQGNEQARRVASRRRHLGDGAFREVVVGDVHCFVLGREGGARARLGQLQSVDGGSAPSARTSAGSVRRAGTGSPRCSQAKGIATRPRGVRISMPSCRRNGS